MRRSAQLLAVTLRNSQRSIKVNLPRLERESEFLLRSLNLSSYSLSIWLTSSATLRSKNLAYRGLDKATDVLSFPFQSLVPPPTSVPPAARPPPPELHGVRDLGELLISVAYVQKQMAQLSEATLDDRLRTLLVHGVCHLLGYDHEVEADANQMEAEEKRLLALIEAEPSLHPDAPTSAAEAAADKQSNKSPNQPAPTNG